MEKLRYSPNLSAWMYVSAVTIDEAALLWAGIDPADIQGHGCYDGEADGFYKVVERFFAGIQDIHSKDRIKKAAMSRRIFAEWVCEGSLPYVVAIGIESNGINAWEREYSGQETPSMEGLITSKTRIKLRALVKFAESQKYPSYKMEVIQSAKNESAVSQNETVSEIKAITFDAPLYETPLLKKAFEVQHTYLKDIENLPKQEFIKQVLMDEHGLSGAEASAVEKVASPRAIVGGKKAKGQT